MCVCEWREKEGERKIRKKTSEKEVSEREIERRNDRRVKEKGREI